jgi:uncharacterized membrane protein
VTLSVRKIVMSGILGAIAILLGVTGLGFIPVPTPAAHATIMHVPAIIGGVVEGPAVGAIVGFIFGLFSFLRATTPLFADPLVAILPRIFIGITAFLVYVPLRKVNEALALVVAAVVGTATNTILVLGMATVRGYLPGNVSVALGITHGVPEIVVAAIIVLAVGLGLKRFTGSTGKVQKS